jgi:Leucine-rich repeat (LRR) protein
MKKQIIFFVIILTLCSCNGTQDFGEIRDASVFSEETTSLTVVDIPDSHITNSIIQEKIEPKVDLSNDCILIQGNIIPIDCEELSFYSSNTFEPYILSEFIWLDDVLSNDDLAEISKLVKLRKLSISSQELTNLDFIKELVELEFLDMSSNNITDFSALQNFPNLKFLNVESNPISDLGFIGFLQSKDILECLIVANTNIESVEGIEWLTHLTMLDISRNDIKNVSSIGNLIFLERILFYKTNIQNLDFTKDMRDLKTIVASFNSISDISSLSDKKDLEYIQLNNNNITDFTPLYNLNAPKEMYLDIDGEQLAFFQGLYPTCSIFPTL